MPTRYPVDLTDADWKDLCPHIPEAIWFSNLRERKWQCRDIVKAVFYRERSNASPGRAGGFPVAGPSKGPLRDGVPDRPRWTNWVRLSTSSMGTPFRVLGGSRIGVLAFFRLSEMSNCCCLPGRAGVSYAGLDANGGSSHKIFHLGGKCADTTGSGATTTSSDGVWGGSCARTDGTTTIVLFAVCGSARPFTRRPTAWLQLSSPKRAGRHC
jgi:hypothetical protein